MPTLKKINAAAGTNFRRTKELVAALQPPAPPPTPPEPAAPPATTFTVTHHDGALFVDGPYNPAMFYRLMILSDNGNPIQDLNPEWAGWPFTWSPNNFPDNPPPAPPLKWQVQEENYISRRWRNRRQYPTDYQSTTYEGEIA